ncbi:MAG TPA: glycosyltransferase family 2 protein [Pirellulales bacterium]|nr:glycosyltransferase family 2 protein [Pirellulales bacterium]
MLSQITPFVLTFNEAPNLRRALDQLRWAREVLVLDSFSTDETERIARGFDNVVFAQRRFDSFSEQCNFGLERIKTDWVMALDADYVVTDELRAEISQLQPGPSVSAYFARFRYCVEGRPLRGSLYPPRAVLLRKSRGHYVQDGHTQRLLFDGAAKFLRGYLLHDDRKSLARWLDSQRNYAKLEAEKLMEINGRAGSLADRLRRLIWPAAPAAFVYTLLVKGCLFDGWPGWLYTLQRTYAELLLSLELLDRRLVGSSDADEGRR